MASFLDKFKVTTALDTNTTMDLSCTHITTSDWLHVAPVYIKEMVPGESLEVHQETFARMASMAVPTFGRGLIHNRAFFVPMRTVFKKWDDFITSADVNLEVQGPSSGNGSSVTVNTVPFVTNRTFVDLFTSGGSSSTEFARLDTASSAASNATLYDIVLSQHTGTGSTDVYTKYYKLTDVGRRFMKILQSLGYNIVWSGGAYSPQEVDETKYSALPLLSWVRILLDWYYPSQYVGDQEYLYAKSILDNTPNASGVYELKVVDLIGLFRYTHSLFSGLANYDSDYFVSAFDNPLGPTQGLVTSNVGIKDINYTRGQLASGSDGQVAISSGTTPGAQNGIAAGTVQYTPENVNGSYYGLRLTQYGLDALKALTDYAKRHQLVGARALDRMYARFGKSLDSAKLDRSNYIGAQNIPLQFGDVMSHAATADEYLGDYAGKGIAYGSDGNFSFSTDEYGYFVIVSSIIPQIGYYQGVDRNLLHLGRTDFWTPEFDQLGNQAISPMEVCVPMNSFSEVVDDAQQGSPDNFNTAVMVNGIFGYTPRYSEYKCGRDKLTGDFRYSSKNGAGDVSPAWHLMRNVGYYLTQGAANMKHSKYFVTGEDYDQYNRIFNYTSGDVDKFYMIHTFNVTSNAPMHSLYDTYKFENEDEGAKKVVADVNGVKVN